MAENAWRISSATTADRGLRIADRGSALADRQGEFSAVLARAGSEEAPVEARAREAAEQLVSIALVQPLLAQLRSTNHAAPPFAPSQGEQQFQTMVDAQVAQRITKASGFGLVDRLAEVMINRVRAGGGKAAE